MESSDLSHLYFFNDSAPTEIYTYGHTLSLHAALPILLRERRPLLAQGSAPRLVQNERHATWATKRTPADGRIDWTLPAAEIDRLIRAVGRPYQIGRAHV